MCSGKHNMIHALEFECQTPFLFYEKCASCPRFIENCPDLLLGIELLRGKKKIVYNPNDNSEDSLSATSFNCLTPLYYFEKTRKNCAHHGRCREEGLLIALLSGKKKLVFSKKKTIEFPRIIRRYKKEDIVVGKVQKTAAL